MEKNVSGRPRMRCMDYIEAIIEIAPGDGKGS